MSQTNAKPVVAAVVPPQTREQCFSDSDWERLAARTEIRYLTAGWDEAEVARLMAGATVILTGWRSGKLTSAVLDPAPDLQVWVHSAGSMATFVTPELWERDLLLSTANGVLADSVAETALSLTLLSLKQWVPMNRAMREGVPWGEARSRCHARELCNLRIGIVGFGAVGRRLAKLLQSYRNLDIVVSDPGVDDAEVEAAGCRRMDFAELCATADVIHDCVPWTPKTVGMFSHQIFRSMKDDAVFINTGRGATVDEEGLVAELQQGRLYACLDVTHPEPPPAGHPFYTLPNCFLLPHIAGAVGNGRKLLGEFAVDEILRFLAGEPLQGAITRRQVEGMTGGTG